MKVPCLFKIFIFWIHGYYHQIYTFLDNYTNFAVGNKANNHFFNHQKAFKNKPTAKLLLFHTENTLIQIVSSKVQNQISIFLLLTVFNSFQSYLVLRNMSFSTVLRNFALLFAIMNGVCNHVTLILLYSSAFIYSAISSSAKGLIALLNWKSVIYLMKKKEK